MTKMLNRAPVLILLIFMLLQACSEPLYTSINNDQLQQKLDQDVIVIDIRTPIEWLMTGVIEGSHLITFYDNQGRINQNFVPRLLELTKDKEREFILICEAGVRTRHAATFLTEKEEFKNVSHARNGMSYWIREGRPVVSISKQATDQ